MTFTRMADRRAVETMVERDDGVVFSMRGGGGGSRLPHDLVHAVVETHLGVPDGVWGCVADGVVWTTMRHVSGRRPPHAQERSQQLKKDRAAAVQWAEGVADLVGRMARGQPVPATELATAGVSGERLAAAADALRDAERRWAALRPGETWTLQWGSEPRRRGSAAGLPAHRRR